METNLVNLIGNLGFPIAVSAYLLVRIESKMENLTCSINNLSNAINQMIRDEKKSNDPWYNIVNFKNFWLKITQSEIFFEIFFPLNLSI